MIDWTQPMDEMTKQWSAAQKLLWANWAEATKRGNQAQAQALWQQILDAWQGSVKQMLDMQSEGLRLWVESLQRNDLPEPMAQWAEQLYQMTKQWTGNQQLLWDQWFQLFEKLDPTMISPMPMGQSSTANQPMLKLWQEMTQQAFSAQQQWMQQWGAWQPGGKSATRK